MASDRPAAGTLSAERKAAMIESVEGIIAARCRQFVRHAPGDRSDHSAAEDAAQACRLALWTLADRFDPAGVAKWSTFAYPAIGHAVARFREEAYAFTLRGQCGTVGHDIDFKSATPPDAGDIGADGDEFDALERSLAAVRRVMFADHLNALTANQRRLVEMVVFGGLTLPQVADQLGQKLSIVELTFRGTVERLRSRGLIPAALVAKLGITPRPTRPAKKWAAGEKDAFLAAARSARPAGEVAAEFGLGSARVTTIRRRLRAKASAAAARLAELCPA